MTALPSPSPSGKEVGPSERLLCQFLLYVVPAGHAPSCSCGPRYFIWITANETERPAIK